MFDQTFSLSDIPQVVVLAFLELLLSADNAIVLAILIAALPEPLRKKALHIGVASAFIFRLAGILGAVYLLKFFWIQLLGSLYLFYLCFKHFISKRKGKSSAPKSEPHFWKIVLMIELLDLAFAVDSIIAGVAFIGPSPQDAAFHPKLWIVYFGGMFGVLGIRSAAKLFTSLLGRFPHLESAAYAMIGWIGLKLCLTSLSLSLPYFNVLFWVGLLSLLLLGFTKKKKDE